MYYNMVINIGVLFYLGNTIYFCLARRFYHIPSHSNNNATVAPKSILVNDSHLLLNNNTTRPRRFHTVPVMAVYIV